MDNLKTLGVKAFIWDFFGKMATHGVSFVISIILARLLDPSDFGLIAIVMVVIGIANVFTDIGLGSALIQRKRVLQIHYSSVFYFNLFISILLTGITYFSAHYISAFYDNEVLVSLMQVMSFSFLLGAFGSVQSIQLRKELNYKILTKISFVSSLTSGVISVYFVFNGAGVWSLVIQLLTASVVYNILIWRNGHWRPTFNFSWKALTQLWGFGFRMFLVGVLDAIYTRIDYLIIGKLFDITTLGFYQRAKSLNLMAIQYTSGSLISVLFPVLSKIQNDLPRFQNIILKSLGIISFAVFFIFGSLYLISEELIVVLFSEKWLTSVEYFKILVLSGFFYPINALLVNVLSSRGNSKAFLRMAVYKKSVAFSNLGIGFLFGIEGFLYGLILVGIINTHITTVIASRESSIPVLKFYKLIVTQVIITALAILISLFATFFLLEYIIIMLFVKLFLFFIFYIILNLMFKTLSFQYFLEQFLPVLKKIIK